MSLNDLQSASSKKGSLSVVSENMTEANRSQPDPTQKAASALDDGMKRKKTPMELFRELMAESDRRIAQAAREAAQSALQGSSISESSTSKTLKRTKSRSPELSAKHARNDPTGTEEPELEEGEIDELSSVQKERLRGMGAAFILRRRLSSAL